MFAFVMWFVRETKQFNNFHNVLLRKRTKHNQILTCNYGITKQETLPTDVSSCLIFFILLPDVSVEIYAFQLQQNDMLKYV